MPEFRQNPLTGVWIALAEERGKRPNEFGTVSVEAAPRPTPPEFVKGCPFCPGNERMTPGEVYAVRKDYRTTDHPGWDVRVVPNKFPAMTIDADGVPTPESIAFKTFDAEKMPGKGPDSSSLRAIKAGVGMHEVLVESPHHGREFCHHPPEHAALVVQTLRHRFRMVLQARDVKYICILKNRGPRAAASIAHPHFQIVAPSIIPPPIKTMVDRQESFAKESGKPQMATLLEEELEAGQRIVATNDEFVTLSPWAPMMPCEMWIVPRERSAFFGELPDGHVGLFAAALRDALRRLAKARNDPDYNLIIHSGPKWHKAEEHHHWFVQILPRGELTPGYELMTGMYMNPLPPEQAATILRDVRVSTEP